MVTSARTPNDPPTTTRGMKSKLCAACKAQFVPKKSRAVMPLTHAVETVRGILIDRLDLALTDIQQIVMEEAAHDLPDEGTRRGIAIRVIQAVNLRLFPEEYEDGEPYTPEPDGRMKRTAKPDVLVPRLPTMAIYARYLLAGQKSPAAKLTMVDPNVPEGETAGVVPVLTEKDLIVLGQRMERRAQATEDVTSI